MSNKRRRNANNNNNFDDDDDNGFGSWGGYMEAKKSKLIQQYKTSTLKQNEKLSDIFKGIAIYVNGITYPNADELKQLIAQHGGIYHTYQSHSTTHIIAMNLPNVKIKQLGSVPIVKPSWIVDSINDKKLLNYQNYLLYTNQSVNQPKIDFSNIQPIKKSTSEGASTTTGAPSTKTAADPNFLEDFYSNSRLHLIATLSTEFKQLINDLREKTDWKFPSREKLKKLNPSASNELIGCDRVIMHIDMDCFFVSVGRRNRPELKDKPIAVTHARSGQMSTSRNSRGIEFDLYKQRSIHKKLDRIEKLDETSSMSEIASCSYEARKFGIKNGMFLGIAMKLCPDLITIPYNFEDYRKVSKILYETIAEYTLDIEAVSCDEMYVDITEILHETNLTVLEWSDYIRNEIFQKTDCPCSAGFGSNRLQARLATKKAKPYGQYYIKPETIDEFMFNILLNDLPGIGYATIKKLNDFGLKTCGDIQEKSTKQFLQEKFGMKFGSLLYEQSKGLDTKSLNYNYERKSISAEINYGIRFNQLDDFWKFFEDLSNEVYQRLIDVNMKAKCLVLKMMIRSDDAPIETAKYLGHGVCDNLTKSINFNQAINDKNLIFNKAKVLFNQFNINISDLRGIGIQLTKLEKNLQNNCETILNKFLTKQTDKVTTTATSTITTTSSTTTTTTTSTITTNYTTATNTITRTATNNQNNNCERKSNLIIKSSKNSNNKKQNGRNNSKKKIKNNSKFKNSIQDFFMNNKTNNFNHKSSKAKKLLNGLEIDLNVLNELPDHIKNEIIAEYNLNESNDYEIPDEKKNVAVVTGRDKENSANYETEFNQNKSPFESLDFDSLKSLIKLWIENENEPKLVDIEMLSDYFKHLAINRKIEMLTILFNFLFRHLTKMNCKWHQAYFMIANTTQEGMVARYGNNLFIQKEFGCCVEEN